MQQADTLPYDPAAVIEFPLGLPGFESARSFALLEDPGAAPALLLQNLESAELCFTVLAMGAIDAEYQLALSAEDREALGAPPAGAPLACLAILAVTENGQLTANLLAPVVVNPQTRQAVQAVRMDRRYSHSHVLGARPGAEAPCW